MAVKRAKTSHNINKTKPIDSYDNDTAPIKAADPDEIELSNLLFGNDVNTIVHDHILDTDQSIDEVGHDGQVDSAADVLFSIDTTGDSTNG